MLAVNNKIVNYLKIVEKVRANFVIYKLKW
jgi:hypothetical protein